MGGFNGQIEKSLTHVLSAEMSCSGLEDRQKAILD
jgi:hypothetical protein